MGHSSSTIPPLASDIATTGTSLAERLLEVAMLGARAGVVMLALTEIMIRLAPRFPLFEMASNLRAQLLVGAVLVGVVLAADRSRLALIAFALILIGSAELARYVFPEGIDSTTTGGQTITVMQYNVLQTNTDYEAIASRVVTEDADVIVLAEVTSRHVEEVTARLPMDDFYAIAHPSDLTDPIGGGLAVLSRLPLTAIDLSAESSPPTRRMIAARVQLPNGGASNELLLVALHPPASRTSFSEVDLRDVQLAGAVELIQNYEGPAMAVGDYNLGPHSALYRDFLDDVQWQDPHRRVGWKATWSRLRFPIGIPIDHVLVSDDFEFRRYDVGDGGGSDHNTLVAELELVGL